MAGIVGLPKRSANERDSGLRFVAPTASIKARQTDAGCGSGGDHTDDGREHPDVRPSRRGALAFRFLLDYGHMPKRFCFDTICVAFGHATSSRWWPSTVELRFATSTRGRQGADRGPLHSNTHVSSQ